MEGGGGGSGKSSTAAGASLRRFSRPGESATSSVEPTGRSGPPMPIKVEDLAGRGGVGALKVIGRATTGAATSGVGSVAGAGGMVGGSTSDSVYLDGGVALTTAHRNDLASDLSSQQIVIEKKARLAAFADDCERHEKTISASIEMPTPARSLLLWSPRDDRR